ncbi:MAG: hypothetical protein ACOCV1_01480, partial [Bacillota bacterium]
KLYKLQNINSDMKTEKQIKDRIEKWQDKIDESGKNAKYKYRRVRDCLKDCIGKDDRIVDAMIPNLRIKRDRLINNQGKNLYNQMIGELMWILDY